MEGADRKYKARSYTLGDAYGVEALQEKLREKAKERLRTVEQRNHAAESRAVLPDIPQRGLSMETAEWPPMNETPEMTYVPARKPVGTQKMKDTINVVISGPRREDRAETPIPAQPAPTTPPTAAEGDGGADSTPEGKQPTQGATAPRRYEGAYQRMLKMDEEEKQRRAKKQHDDMDWLPYS